MLLVRPQGLFGRRRDERAALLWQSPRCSSSSRRSPRCRSSPTATSWRSASASLNYTVLATAWALFSGPTRYVSLATVAFFGIGAYTVAVLAETMPLAAGAR